MKIDRLCLEVTRKCNMKCDHCLRGDAQNKKMTQNVISALTRHVDYIREITFSGGEPTLALDVIQDFILQCKWNGCKVGNFYIVTNGKEFKKELCDIVEDLYYLCDDNEISGLAVSDDFYHDEFRSKNVQDVKERYTEHLVYAKGLPEEIFRFEDKKMRGDEGILRRGRASEWGARDEEPLDYLRFENFKTRETITGEMYITCDGDVIGDMNLSYAQMKQYVRGNVLNWSELMDNIEQSTHENYEWCKKNCSSFEGCPDWEEHEKALKGGDEDVDNDPIV